MSDIFVDNIKHQSSQGSGTITLGASGETVALASGAKVSNLNGQVAPAFSVVLSSDQTVATSTWTKMNFDSEILDSDSAFNTTDKQFVVPSGKAGKYLIFAQLYRNFSTNGTNIRGAITKNDSRVITSIFTDGQGIANSAIVSAVMNLVVGDTIHIETFQDRGSDEGYSAANNQFYGYRIAI
jgi:hypothetical protein